MRRCSLSEPDRPPCLDLRSVADYKAGHLPGAVNIPFEELPERLHELPPHGARVLLYGPLSEEAARFLAAKPRWDLLWCDESLPQSGLSQDAGAPLWRPASWLAEHWHHVPPGGRVFDVAMGAGRNAVFMAMRGFRVSGEDILPEAVDKARNLAARNGVTIDARVGDLTRPGALPEAAYEGILVFNYLERTLLPALARALAPGGVLIYETFLEGQEHSGPPCRPEHLLRPGELRQAFAELAILDYREGAAQDGRRVASLAARLGTA